MLPLPAIPLQTTAWLNAPAPVTLESLRGKVVLLEAFQMLCPGCVSHALPQAKRARQLFAEEDLAVIGLHTVFEHHDVQGTARALEVFLHEYGIGFPVGIDAPSENGNIPKTMRAYGMQGTPTAILIDRRGNVRSHHYGHQDDMRLGADIMALLREDTLPDHSRDLPATETGEPMGGCTDQGCSAEGGKGP